MGGLFLILLFVVLIGAALYLLLPENRALLSKSSQDEGNDSQLEILFNAGMVSLMIVGFLADRILQFLFPVATFAIGDGVKRYQTRVFWRNGVIFTFVISVLASILANWLT
jgi:small-conductance mechanosensitive channel